jgi:rhomboid protease GluP
MVRHRGIPVTAALVAVNVLVFLLQEIPGPLSDRIYEDGVLVTQNVLAGEYWRLFTSMFLHANIEHIFSNMLMLYYVGEAAERMLGSVRYACIYLLSGVAGNLLSMAAETRLGESWVSLGASGAIFGIVGALLVMALRFRGRTGTITVPRIVLLIAYSLYSGFHTTGTNNWAHIGGLFGGVILTLLLGPHREQTE